MADITSIGDRYSCHACGEDYEDEIDAWRCCARVSPSYGEMWSCDACGCHFTDEDEARTCCAKECSLCDNEVESGREYCHECRPYECRNCRNVFEDAGDAVECCGEPGTRRHSTILWLRTDMDSLEAVERCDDPYWDEDEEAIVFPDDSDNCDCLTCHANRAVEYVREGRPDKDREPANADDPLASFGL